MLFRKADSLLYSYDPGTCFFSKRPIIVKLARNGKAAICVGSMILEFNYQIPRAQTFM